MQAIVSYMYYIFALLFSLAYYVVVTHIRGHIVSLSPPSPLPATGESPQQYLQPIFLKNSLEIKLCNIAFPLLPYLFALF